MSTQPVVSPAGRKHGASPQVAVITSPKPSEHERASPTDEAGASVWLWIWGLIAWLDYIAEAERASGGRVNALGAGDWTDTRE